MTLQDNRASGGRRNGKFAGYDICIGNAKTTSRRKRLWATVRVCAEIRDDCFMEWQAGTMYSFHEVPVLEALKKAFAAVTVRGMVPKISCHERRWGSP